MSLQSSNRNGDAGLVRCPPADTLRQHLLGKLHGPAAETLDEHFAECAHCARAAQQLTSADELIQSLRECDPQPEFASEVQGLVESVRSMAFDAEAPDPEMGTEETAVSGNTVSLPKTQNAGGWETPTVRGLDSESTSAAGDERVPPGLELPAIVGRHYRLLQEIGSGGMGIVYRAEDTRLKRQVAVKMLRSSVHTTRTERLRLINEAQAAAGIRHDNVAEVLDVGDHGGVPFLVMPLLTGESLRARLNRTGRLEPAEVLRIGSQIAQGLAAAHAKGIVHRDIKPENIWLEEENDRVRILDFGLARSIEEDSTLTHEGVIVGTPLYMSPEQASGGEIDPRTDLFSLGGILYRAATGEPAFVGRNAMHTTVAVLTKDPVPAKKLNPTLTPSICKLIHKLLQKDASRRFQTASDLVDAIDATRVESARVPRRSAKWSTVLLAVAAIVVCGVIVIRITDKNGKAVVLEVDTDNDKVTTDLSKAAPGSSVSISRKVDGAATGNASPDRMAEEVSEYGEALGVLLESAQLFVGPRGRGPRVSTLAEARSKPITAIILQSPTPRHFAAAAHLDQLEQVRIWSATVSRVAMAMVTQSKALRGLSLKKCRVDDDAWELLARANRLEELLLATPVTEKTCLEIGKISTLKSLSIAEARPEHIRGLAKLKALENISLGGNSTDEALHAVAELKLPKLTSLGAIGVSLTDHGVEGISRIHTLELVNFKFAPVTDAGLKHLKKLPKLRTLFLQHAKITAESSRSILTLKSIEHLVLRGDEITDDVVREVTKLPALARLEIYSNSVTDSSVEAFEAMQQKRLQLTLWGTSISNQAIGRLKKLHPKWSLGLGPAVNSPAD